MNGFNFSRFYPFLSWQGLDCLRFSLRCLKPLVFSIRGAFLATAVMCIVSAILFFLLSERN